MREITETELTIALNSFESSSQIENNKLVTRVYNELRKAACYRISQMPRSATMTPTVLVHEAFIKLFSDPLQWNDRQHFFSVASCAMRQIMVDFVRRKSSLKRGSFKEVTLDDEIVSEQSKDFLVVELDDLLNTLAKSEPELVKVVELRFFVGLTSEETAEALGISRRTVHRHWEKAKHLLADTNND